MLSGDQHKKQEVMVLQRDHLICHVIQNLAQLYYVWKSLQ